MAEPNLDSSKTEINSEKEIRDRVFKFTATQNRNVTTKKKVQDALSIIGLEDKGASVYAIVNWILGNYPVLDNEKLKLEVKKCILRGLTAGIFQRSASSKGASGTCGSFVLSSNVKHPKGTTKKRSITISPILNKAKNVPGVPKKS